MNTPNTAAGANKDNGATNCSTDKANTSVPMTNAPDNAASTRKIVCGREPPLPRRSTTGPGPRTASSQKHPAATARLITMAAAIEPTKPHRGKSKTVTPTTPPTAPSVFTAYNHKPGSPGDRPGHPVTAKGRKNPIIAAGGKTSSTDKPVFTAPPRHPSTPAGPSHGHKPSAHHGNNNIGTHNNAKANSAPPSQRHGRLTRPANQAPAIAPKAKPRKKHPNTRADEPALAPSKSTIRRVHNT
jgi:hypothetical protein